MKKNRLQSAWKNSLEAEARRKSAKALIGLLLAQRPKEAKETHIRQLLSACIWKITEANGKWNTRYSSECVFNDSEQKLNHEHVYERAMLIDEMLANPLNLDDILKKAIGCVVSESEHRLLTKISQENHDLQGWERYEAAKIKVVDRAKIK